MTDGRIDGTAFAQGGDGPPVVLVHGLGLNRHMWDGQLAALGRRFFVVRYDLLGHGDSDKPEGPYRMERFVDQLSALIDGLKLGGCALVGFSLGGPDRPGLHARPPRARVRPGDSQFGA